MHTSDANTTSPTKITRWEAIKTHLDTSRAKQKVTPFSSLLHPTREVLRHEPSRSPGILDQGIQDPGSKNAGLQESWIHESWNHEYKIMNPGIQDPGILGSGSRESRHLEARSSGFCEPGILNLDMPLRGNYYVGPGRGPSQ